MIEAAVGKSLRTARQEQERAAGLTTAGASSSKSRAPTNKAAALRAAAAEGRLSRTQKDDSDDVLSISSSDDDDGDDESQDEPLSKGKGKQAIKPRNTSKPQHMTIAELRRMKREERRQARSGTAKEEAQLRKQLGRKLTHVSALVAHA